MDCMLLYYGKNLDGARVHIVVHMAYIWEHVTLVHECHWTYQTLLLYREVL